MIKINSKTLKYLKNSSGNFAWQFKKGQAKELKIRQDREREREGDGESLGRTLRRTLPFIRSVPPALSLLLSQPSVFWRIRVLYFFCLPILYFALRSAFGFWFHTIYFCYFLLILNIFRTAYAFIISPVPTDHFRLRLSFRFSRFSISFLSLLFSVSLVQLSQCHKHRNPFFLPHQRCKRNKENQRLEYEP